MLRFTQPVRARVIRGGAYLVNLETLAYRRYNTHKFFSAIRHDDFRDTMDMEPEGAEIGNDLCCKFGFERKESNPPGAQIHHCQHIFEPIGCD